MKVLVTGGAGYIGSIAAAQLLNEGHDVVIYDNLSTGFRWAVPGTAKFIFGDIRDESLLTRVMKDSKIEAVLHFAGRTVAPESVSKPLEYYDVNTQGGLCVLRACRSEGVRNFIFSSTAAVYGNAANVPVHEAEPLRPLTPYGASKLFVEQMIEEVARDGGLRYAILRYFNVAGATPDLTSGQRTEGATHLVKVASEAAAGRRDGVDVYGVDYPTRDGTGIRDFIHVCDLVDIHLRALAHLAAGGANMVMNCGYGRGVSVREVLTTMQEVSGFHFQIREAPRREGDIIESYADVTLLQKTFGWRPRFQDLRLICRTSFEWERRLSSGSL